MNTRNLLLDTDSYKTTHYLQYPKGTEYVSSYIESRGGRFNRTVFFGLQPILAELEKGITAEDVQEAEDFIPRHGMANCNYEGYKLLLEKYKGKLPISIYAVPEGTVMPTSNVMVQVVNTDPDFYWLTSYLETKLLRVWYPTTVATLSHMIKRLVYQSLLRTSENPDEQINFKLHDFGCRGASSLETASIGGCAHLVNFFGSDTIPGIRYAKKYYVEDMAGFSIDATEHSVMTAKGRDGELDMLNHVIDLFAKPGKMFAVVADSYDIWKFIRQYLSIDVREKLINSGAKLIVRPDSGNPVAMVRDVIKALMNEFGYTTNKKGFKVLPPYLGVIQGDGVNYDSIKDILLETEANKFSTDNIAFGMGGALLQNLDRDFLRFAMKASARYAQGKWHDVYKDPVTDSGKKSKKGRLALVKINGQYATVPYERANRYLSGNQLVEVFRNGRTLKVWHFKTIRTRANQAIA